MIIKAYALDTARAVAFLSRIPMPAFVFAGDDGKLGRTARAFPLAGLLIGIVPAIVFLVMLGLRADRLMAALVAIAVLVVISGALHEDGLADTADGIGGGRDRDHALVIMKDSRIGSYGAVTLILSIALRAAALAAIAREVPATQAAFAIPVAACLGRAALVWHWYRLPPAKPDGLAASSGKPGESAMHVAVVSGCLIAALIVWPVLGLLPLVCSLLAAGISVLAFTIFIRRKLNGHTGDTLGAAEQISEIAAFCALAMAL